LSSKTPYCQYSRYLVQRYGDTPYRVPLDLGFGCPNRETDGTGGCTFCDEDGARARQNLNSGTLEEQVADGIKFARRRYGARNFMAYIQAFTGTFAPASEQRRICERILDAFPFCAVHIGTRPDCLPSETLEFLGELKKRTDAWVELGIQTVHDQTLRRIQRGHDWDCSRQAIETLAELGINVAAHVILGLPGETATEFNQTAETLAKLPLDAIKIHNLHILRGSQMAHEFERNPFPVLDEYEYAEVLIKFLRRLPAELPIMRICTDSPAEDLIAPKWTLSKGEFQEMLARQMTLRQVAQGDLHAPSAPPDRSDPHQMAPTATQDGSMTLWNPEFNEHYHSPVGALSEAEAKYILPGGLQNRLGQGDVRVLDVCFGLGYNTLVACELASTPLEPPESEAPGRLHVTALEIDRGAVGQAANDIAAPPDANLDWQGVLRNIYETGSFESRYCTIDMHWGDARHTIKKIEENAPFDLVFLDPFSTQRNSELWTVEFFEKLRQVLHPKGLLLTYCTAIPVLSGLIEAGFAVGCHHPPTPHRASTVAALAPELIPEPLTEKQLDAIHTTPRGIPYHDPYGVWNNKTILRERQKQVERKKNGTEFNRMQSESPNDRADKRGRSRFHSAFY
jgi:radical SAM protein (TIGR01212 family)